MPCGRPWATRLVDWVTNCQLLWISGNVACSRRAANPLISKIKDQEAATFCFWGHEDFGRKRPSATYVDRATGIRLSTRLWSRARYFDRYRAYATDKLTAATIHNGEVEIQLRLI